MTNQPLGELSRAAKRWSTLQADWEAPEAAQRATWSRIRPRLRRSGWWHERLGGLPDALEAFEPTSFPDYQAPFEQAWHTGVNPLTGEAVVLWALSSGSTGNQKKFPWTQAFRDDHIEGSDLTLPMFKAIARAKGRRPVLSLVATNAPRRAPNGAPVAYLTHHFADPTGRAYPRAIDSDASLFARWLPVYALAQDLGGFRALTADHIEMLVDRIANDRDGMLARLTGSEPAPTGMVAPSPDEERVQHVRSVLMRAERPSLTDLWPHLAFILTWRSNTAGLQARRLVSACSTPIALFDLPYATSEGPVCSPDDPLGIGGPVNPRAAIHEFLPLDAAPASASVLRPWELEAGQCYELLLTTSLGMVRYRIGDVVECMGHRGRTAIVRFHGRRAREVSFGMTTVAETEIVEAVSRIPTLDPRWVVFAPSEDGRALQIVTPTPLPLADIEALHTHLAAANDTYRETTRARMRVLENAVVPANAPLWRDLEPDHAQQKRPLLLSSTVTSLTPD